MKIRPIRDYLFHEERTDGHGDMIKFIVAFRNFVNAPRQDDERNKLAKIKQNYNFSVQCRVNTHFRFLNNSSNAIIKIKPYVFSLF